jgi:hypothetical protein
MLDDIHLTADQLALLKRAAVRGGGQLATHHHGGQQFSATWDAVAFTGTLEDIMVLYAVVDTHDPRLGGVLRTRRVFDGDVLPPAGEPATFYWPGLLSPEQAPLTADELRSARQLAGHLAAVHKNSAAPGNDLATNREGHHHEHFGPGGLRTHPYEDLSYDDADLAAVLAEAAAEDGEGHGYQEAGDYP